MRTDTENPDATLFGKPFSAEEMKQLIGPPKDLRPYSATHDALGVFVADVWQEAMGVEIKGYAQVWLVLRTRHRGMRPHAADVRTLPLGRDPGPRPPCPTSPHTW
ncbi:hypothetical protein [Streptomyces shaanxiensis]|uniref:DUF4287 domain-containing protein n=1 Tax=Streptomyces shaanxiensis TaxID=653357 RepID=A0ABP7VLV5_9ACTN